MAQEKKKFESFVSEKGVASWPHLNSPDTQYDADGVFHTKLVYDPNNAKHAAFLAFLQERLEAHVEAEKEEMTPLQLKKLIVNDIVKDELDREGELTGMKTVAFKMYATGKAKDGTPTKREPRFFDAKGSKLTSSTVPRLSGGSELKIEYSISGYSTGKGTGITLYLSNVQIIKAVEYTGSSSKFGDEGDGFTAPESTEERMPSAETTPEEGQQDGDF